VNYPVGTEGSLYDCPKTSTRGHDTSCGRFTAISWTYDSAGFSQGGAIEEGGIGDQITSATSDSIDIEFRLTADLPPGKRTIAFENSDTIALNPGIESIAFETGDAIIGP